MRIGQHAAAVLLAVVAGGCSDTPTGLGPTGIGTAGATGRAGRPVPCTYQDTPATTRTAAAGCSNTRLVLPTGWRLQVRRSDGARAGRAGEVSADVLASFAAISSPDATYLGTTQKIDISGLPAFSTHSSVTDGVERVSFDTPMESYQVPESWSTWSSPPESESPTPAVLYTQGVDAVTLRLAPPTTLFGFELEPDVFAAFSVTADFFSAGVRVGSVTRSVDGAGGARLFAARSDGSPFDSVSVTASTASGEPYGFAVAQLRYLANGTWTRRAALPTPRSAVAIGVSSSTLYAVGGLRSGTPLRLVQAYTASSNSWSAKTSLPAARFEGDGAAMLTGVLYVAGGRDANRNPTRTLYAYNVNTNTWSTRAPLPTPSGCGGSAVISGRVYVLTGCDLTTGYKAKLHRYDPTTNRWTALASAPVPHGFPAVGVIGGRLYVAGGRNAAGSAIRTLHVYDPATNVWSARAQLPVALFSAAGGVIDGKLYVVGGRNATGAAVASTYVYDPTANSWGTRLPMPTARDYLGAGVISRLLYAVGGQANERDLTTVERFKP